jgi:Ulp1 family protease
MKIKINWLSAIMGNLKVAVTILDSVFGKSQGIILFLSPYIR